MQLILRPVDECFFSWFLEFYVQPLIEIKLIVYVLAAASGAIQLAATLRSSLNGTSVSLWP